MKFQAYTGNYMHVKIVEHLPLNNTFEHNEQYTKFYCVRSHDENGCVFFYVGKGHIQAPNEYVVWYPNGNMWAGFAPNIRSAVEGAMKDGWKYAN